MNLNKIVDINKRYSDGNLINRSPLEFTLDYIKDKPETIKIPYILRAILTTHSFEDGNKRTASAVLTDYLKKNKIKYDDRIVYKNIIKIAKNNIKNIARIKWLIRDCIKI